MTTIFLSVMHVNLHVMSFIFQWGFVYDSNRFIHRILKEEVYFLNLVITRTLPFHEMEEVYFISYAVLGRQASVTFSHE